jgi:hypothetical protein
MRTDWYAKTIFEVFIGSEYLPPQFALRVLKCPIDISSRSYFFNMLEYITVSMRKGLCHSLLYFNIILD